MGPALDEGPTLRALAAAKSMGRGLVVGQLGQSLDGRIATESGHSHYVNGPAALDRLHALRAAVDAVVVGCGTALADDPRLTVRRVAGTSPARVLLDRRRTVPASARLFDGEDGVRRLVLGPARADDPPGVETLEADAAPRAILAALAERGLLRVLVEGGANTVSGFLAAGALDRLCVAVAPLLIGSGIPALSLPPIATLHEALRPAVDAIALPGGDVLFDCDLRRSA